MKNIFFKITRILFTVVFIFLMNNIFAQIGINEDGSLPDASAMLDVTSTNKGVLVPRMTTAQRTLINSPATGLLVFDTDETSFWFFNGTTWVDLSATEEAWLKTDGSAITSINDSIYTNGDVGIGTSTPKTKLHVDGIITAGANNSPHSDTLYDGSASIIIPGSTSDYVISVENDNGSIQHTWNATGEDEERLIVSNEKAYSLSIGVTTSNPTYPLFEFKKENDSSSSSVSGDTINWETVFKVTQENRFGINEDDPDDMLHVTTGGYGTRIRAENTNDGYAGFLSKNSFGEMYFGLQGNGDTDPGFYHIYDNTVGKRRLTIDDDGYVGLSVNRPNVRLDVNGDIEYTGTITDVSDRRLKENLLPISNALSGLLQLNGYTYSMKNDTAHTREYGLMAQDVQKIFPEMVSNIDAEGKYLGLSYIQFVPVLVEGMKEQQAIIEQQQKEIKALKQQNAKINQLEQQNTQMQVMLEQIQAELNQNSENSSSSEK